MTTTRETETPGGYWKFGWQHWVLLGVSIIVLIAAYSGGLAELIHRWNSQPEYSHGYLIPLVTLYFIWEKRNTLKGVPSKASWISVPLVVLALLIAVTGEVSALFILVHVSFILILFALSLALLGWRGTALLAFPLAFLVFSVPLPYFLEASLTAELQLISSSLGVGLIRLCEIPVFLEGNVIDLGVYKLQVVEACSGLTYLYPLLGFGCICAYIYKGALWKRITLILSTIPITILLNSFRIGAIGILVNRWGTAMAEGFLHDFEGWAVFMVCIAILVLEVWLLNHVGHDRLPLREVFGLDEAADQAPPPGATISVRPIPPAFIAVCVLIATALPLIHIVDSRVEIKPKRTPFVMFPMSVANWQGEPHSLDKAVINALKLTDYLSADFSERDKPGSNVNFYVAYYESQRKGISPHSPRVCLPGGGWEISELSRMEIPLEGSTAVTLPVNRAVIRKGSSAQLVYYWFQQRGRYIANEYYMKWYLFSDAFTMNRTDGALVRLSTPVIPGEPADGADQRLTHFISAVFPLMPQYVPN